MKAKQTKTAANLSLKFKTASEKLVEGIQAHITSKASMETAITDMRKTKVRFGKSRATCAMLSFVYDQLATLKTAKGTALAASTRNDYLNAIKKAVNNGTELNLNSRRKPKPAGQSQVPKGKDKAKLTEGMAVTDVMATDEAKPAAVKPAAFKSNDDAIEAIKVAVKTVKTSCTAKQWEAIATLYPKVAELAE